MLHMLFIIQKLAEIVLEIPQLQLTSGLTYDFKTLEFVITNNPHSHSKIRRYYREHARNRKPPMDTALRDPPKPHKSPSAYKPLSRLQTIPHLASPHPTGLKSHGNNSLGTGIEFACSTMSITYWASRSAQTQQLTWPLRWLSCVGQALAVTILGVLGMEWPIGGFGDAKGEG